MKTEILVIINRMSPVIIIVQMIMKEPLGWAMILGIVMAANIPVQMTRMKGGISNKTIRFDPSLSFVDNQYDINQILKNLILGREFQVQVLQVLVLLLREFPELVQGTQGHQPSVGDDAYPVADGLGQ